jgi:hypothetical protein
MKVRRLGPMSRADATFAAAWSDEFATLAGDIPREYVFENGHWLPAKWEQKAR